MNEEGNVTSIVKVTFDGDELEAIRQGERAWVVLKRLCEVFGIQAHGQAAKLKEVPWACTQIICAVAEDGKVREQFCLDVDSLAGWLFTINTKKVRPELRDKLIRYQRECARVLRSVFFGGPSAPTPALAQVTERLDVISRHINVRILDMCRSAIRASRRRARASTSSLSFWPERPALRG